MSHLPSKQAKSLLRRRLAYKVLMENFKWLVFVRMQLHSRFRSRKERRKSGAGIGQECAREGVKRHDRPPMRANAEDQRVRRGLLLPKKSRLLPYTLSLWGLGAGNFAGEVEPFYPETVWQSIENKGFGIGRGLASSAPVGEASRGSL